jgi:hypothetical protein
MPMHLLLDDTGAVAYRANSPSPVRGRPMRNGRLRAMRPLARSFLIDPAFYRSQAEPF